jgi:hypothetical protein
VAEARWGRRVEHPTTDLLHRQGRGRVDLGPSVPGIRRLDLVSLHLAAFEEGESD